MTTSNSALPMLRPLVWYFALFISDRQERWAHPRRLQSTSSRFKAIFDQELCRRETISIAVLHRKQGSWVRINRIEQTFHPPSWNKLVHDNQCNTVLPLPPTSMSLALTSALRDGKISKLSHCLPKMEEKIGANPLLYCVRIRLHWIGLRNTGDHDSTRPGLAQQTLRI